MLTNAFFRCETVSHITRHTDEWVLRVCFTYFLSLVMFLLQKPRYRYGHDASKTLGKPARSLECKFIVVNSTENSHNCGNNFVNYNVVCVVFIDSILLLLPASTMQCSVGLRVVYIIHHLSFIFRAKINAGTKQIYFFLHTNIPHTVINWVVAYYVFAREHVCALINDDVSCSIITV